MTFVPVREKAITKQSLSMTKGRPYYLGLLSEVYLGQEVKAAPGQVAKNPPHLVDAVQLDTGELFQVICPAVMAEELAKAFPGGVKGVCIEVTIIPPRDGKRYNLCNIFKIQAPEDFAKHLAAFGQPSSPAAPVKAPEAPEDAAQATQEVPKAAKRRR